MQTYELTLTSPVSKSFRCTKAANSCDLNMAKKLRHHMKIETDIPAEYGVGLIVGSSGSGKTSMAKHIFGNDCMKTLLRDDVPLIDQMPKHLSYDECVKVLTSIGLL